MAGEEVFWVFFLLSIVSAYCFSRTPVSYAAVVLFYVVMPVSMCRFLTSCSLIVQDPGREVQVCFIVAVPRVGGNVAGGGRALFFLVVEQRSWDMDRPHPPPSWFRLTN